MAANHFGRWCFFQRWFGFQAKAAGGLLAELAHFITRDLLPFSEILNMRGIPESLVTDPKSIDGIVTIEQTYAVVGGVTAQHVEYPDHHTLIFYSYLAVAPAPCRVWVPVVV